LRKYNDLKGNRLKDEELSELSEKIGRLKMKTQYANVPGNMRGSAPIPIDDVLAIGDQARQIAIKIIHKKNASQRFCAFSYGS
jgi:hypothetical protein